MKVKTLILTTVMSTGLMLGYSSQSFAADNITTSTVKTADKPISTQEIADPRVAAASFVEHVNYARVALAMKNTDLAKQHITQARNMVAIIKGTTVEQRHITKLESGRVVYQYDTEYKYHYFPIETGLVQVKQMSNGPIWAKNDLAVTDADIVYLSLDLSGNTVEKYLADSEAAIGVNNLKEADNQLAKLTNEVVTVDSTASVPSDKARDNIALARNFLAGQNYEGASFALKHADEALDEMQKADAYKSHRAEIVAMRKDVSNLQGYITKNDPSMIQKADSDMKKWWQEMKNWSDAK